MQKRDHEETKAVIIQTVILVACALALGGFLSFFFVAGCIDNGGPGERLKPFYTVESPTQYTATWREVCTCWGADEWWPEPMVLIVPPDRWNDQGDEGFPCRGSETGCTGTIEDGLVKVGPKLLALSHEFSHAARWYAKNDMGENDTHDGPNCYGVAK